MKDSFDFHSFCPFRVCPLGAHIDHQGGLVTGFALDKGINFDFSATELQKVLFLIPLKKK